MEGWTTVILKLIQGIRSLADKRGGELASLSWQVLKEDACIKVLRDLILGMGDLIEEEGVGLEELGEPWRGLMKVLYDFILESCKLMAGQGGSEERKSEAVLKEELMMLNWQADSRASVDLKNLHDHFLRLRDSVIKQEKGGGGLAPGQKQYALAASSVFVELQRKLGGSVQWTLTHAFFLKMGGLTIKQKSGVFPLDSTNLFIELLERGLIGFPSLTKKDIKDRSKADGIMKTLALAQISWSVIQCIGRAIVGLPISELELGTCAFVFCTFIIYTAWWRKPKDVQAPVQLHCPDPNRLPDTLPRSPHVLNGTTRNESGFPPLTELLATSTFGVLINAIHCLAWNFTFPTKMEQTIWRVCSVTATGTPVVIGFHQILYWIYGTGGAAKTRKQGFKLSGFFCLLVYVAARLVIIVQFFVCLRAMPAGVYERLSWPEYFPHL